MADRVDAISAALPLTRAVVVIGAGTMGIGIAEVAAGAGHRVHLRDSNAAVLERGMKQIHRNLYRRLERGRLDPAQADAILARLVPSDGNAPLHDAGLVIEVVVENLDVKVDVLRDIEARVAPDTIIATNTSSLSITAIAARLERPAQVVGMHFFNPATVLPLVEVVRGAATAPHVTQTIADTARAWGKAPVICRSTPGFIVNRVARPFYGEALRLLQHQAATPATIDAVMRESGGFRMGPCELMDLIGHDVNFAVTRAVCDGFFGDPRYQPSLVQKELVDAGWLGRKSGRGFHEYGDGAAAAAPDDASPRGLTPANVRIEGELGPASPLVDLLLQQDRVPVQRCEGAGVLRADGFALALSDGRSATERSAALGEAVVLFDLALDFATCTRVALAAPVQASAEHLGRAIGLFALLDKQVSVLDDAPGMAVTRTVAMLVNEAADALHQGIATADDIDAAMRLGVNYPVGPLAWGRRLGLAHVAGVLQHLHDASGEPRYRLSSWLRHAVHDPRDTAHG